MRVGSLILILQNGVLFSIPDTKVRTFHLHSKWFFYRPKKIPGHLSVRGKSVLLSLGELGCTASALETVLLSLGHSRVSGQEACLLERGAELRIILKERSGDTVTDSAGLAGDTAAVDAADDVELFTRAGEFERLADNELESLKSEIIVYISVVDDDFAGAGVKTDSGN